MLSQDDLTYQPTMIEAKVQSYVAKFLGDKEILLNLQANSSPSISGAAKSLMVTQLQLEGQLPDMLAKAKGITAGTYQYVDLFAVYKYATALNKHINNVKNLQDQATAMPQYMATTVPSDQIFGMPKNTVYTLGGVAAIAIVAWYIWNK